MATRRHNTASSYTPWSNEGQFVAACMEAGYPKGVAEDAWNTATAGSLPDALTIVQTFVEKTFGKGDKEQRAANGRAATLLLTQIRWNLTMGQ